MKRSTTFGSFRSPLPRAAEPTEAVYDFLLCHSVAVIFDPNLLDAVERIASEGNFDLLRVGIEGIPDQLDHPGDRFGGAKALEVVLVKLDVEIHGSRVSHRQRRLAELITSGADS